MPFYPPEKLFVNEATGELSQQPTRDTLPLQQHPKELDRLERERVAMLASYGAQIDVHAELENRPWHAYWDKKEAA